MKEEINKHTIKIIDILQGSEKAIQLFLQFVDNIKDDQQKVSILIEIENALNKIEYPEQRSEEDLKLFYILQYSALEDIIKQINNYRSIKMNSTYIPLFNCSSSSTNSALSNYLPLSQFQVQPHNQEEFSTLINVLATDVNQLKIKEDILWVKYKINRGNIANNIENHSMEVNILESSNSAYFAINVEGTSLIFNECWCTDQVSRKKEHSLDFRGKIESGIIKEINKNYKDVNSLLKIINIGSDRIGSLVILAKLKLLGFKKIELINIDQHGILNCIEYKKQDEEFEKLIPKIFGKDFKYRLVVDATNHLFARTNEQEHTEEPQLTVIFAEDLGNQEEDYTIRYNNIITPIVNFIAQNSNSLVIYHDANGEIHKKMNHSKAKMRV